MKTCFIMPSLRLLIAITLIVGVIYPVSVTLVGQTLFPRQAKGSLIWKDHQVIASTLLAQKILSPRLFWPRPSAADYKAVPSGASNLGPTSDTLKQEIQKRQTLGMTQELLFSSGSGLDPHISPDAAFGQLPRIVSLRKLSENQTQELKRLIENSVESRGWNFLGEPRINVMELNLKLLARFGQ